MWVIQLVLLCNLFALEIFSAEDDWPNCGNFASKKGFPIGCKTHHYEFCATQSDECRNIVCNVINKEFANCGKACKDNPNEYGIIIDGGVRCYCSTDDQKMCGNIPTRDRLSSTNISHFQHIQNHSNLIQEKAGEIWGGTVQLPWQDLLPVFCYDKFSCDPITKSVCINCKGTCYRDGYCYHIERHPGWTGAAGHVPCKGSLAIAIETMEERQFIYQLIDETFIENYDESNFPISTAAIVPASTGVIIWDGYDYPVDLQIVGHRTVPLVDYDLVVSMRRQGTGNGQIEWQFDVPGEADVKVIMCKRRCSDCGQTSETTTTKFSTTNRFTSTTTSQITTVTPETTTYEIDSTSKISTTSTTTGSTTSGLPETTTEKDASTETSTETDTTTEPTGLTDETDNESSTPIEETTTPMFESTTPLTCPGKCVKMDQYGEEWECCSERVCSKECPLDAIGTATWQCGFSNFETVWPSYNSCESSWVQEIDELIEAGNISSFDLAVLMDQYLDESSMLGKDMSAALKFTLASLDLLIQEQENSNDRPDEKLHQIKFQTELGLRVVGKILALEKPWEQLAQFEKLELGKMIWEVSNKYGFAVTRKAAEIGNDYSMSYEEIIKFKAQFLKINTGGNGHDILQFPKEDDPLQNSIIITQLPTKLAKNKEMLTLEAVSNNIPMEFAENMFPGRGNSFRGRSKKLNSGMVSMSLLFGSQKKAIHAFDSGSAVIIKFRHERMAKGPSFSRVERELYPGENPTAIQGTAKCVFWDEKIGTHGAWDTRGCRLINSSHWYTYCECNHLSSFALLMDVHEFIAKSKALEVLGIVCSSLSVICLALTLFLLHNLNLKHTDRNSIGKHLCLCLMIGHLMALLVLDRLYFNMPQEICIGVGVILHYVFLAAFMWMAIEGHHLYRMVVQVFDTGRDFSRFYLAAGYGIPLVIVVLTCIITGSMQDAGYANDDLCWLSSPSYVWAFMGPVLCLIIANFVVLIIAMKVAISASNKQNKRLVERVKIWIRGWFSMAALLGVTWIFGFFYIQVNPAFAYIYVILNGCQGIFLFLTRVVFNKQIRSALRQTIVRKKLLSQFYGFQWLKRSTESTSQGPIWLVGNTASSHMSSSTPHSTSQAQKVFNKTSRPTSSNISSDGGFFDAATENRRIENIWTPGARNVSPSRKNSREEHFNAHQQRNRNSGDGLPVRVSFRDAEILFELPEED